MPLEDIRVTADTITAYLTDGRTISVPLAWSWRLSEATPEQRANFEIIGDGEGVHWPDIDEDISAQGMLYGVPAPRPMFVRATRPVPAWLGADRVSWRKSSVGCGLHNKSLHEWGAQPGGRGAR